MCVTSFESLKVAKTNNLSTINAGKVLPHLCNMKKLRSDVGLPIQHLVMPCAVLVFHPHPCTIFPYGIRNSASTNTCAVCYTNSGTSSLNNCTLLNNESQGSIISYQVQHTLIVTE